MMAFHIAHMNFTMKRLTCISSGTAAPSGKSAARVDPFIDDTRLRIYLHDQSYGGAAKIRFMDSEKPISRLKK